MDESALRNQLNNLEALRSALHSSFRFWEWMVVVGLIIDAVVILKEFWDDWEEFKRECDVERGIRRPPRRPSILLLAMALLGTGLIAFGISKELSIDSRIEEVETNIRGVNEQLFGIVSKEAEDAASVSATAKSDAKNAHDEADEAKASAKTAGELASSAESDAQSARSESAGLTKDLSVTAAKLANVEAKRDELEGSLINLAKCSAPRVVPLITKGDRSGGSSTVDPLRPFAGYKAIIGYVSNDAEARAAWSLTRALRSAQWNVPDPQPGNDIPDGVYVDPFVSPEDGSMMRAQWHSNDVADLLVSFLHSYDWIAKEGSLTDEHHRLIRDLSLFPPDSLRVRVGLYPAVSFVVPRGAKDFAEAEEQFKLSREQINKQWEQQRAQNEAKRLKAMTPDEAKEYEAEEEREDKEIKAMEDVAGSPCKPLNPLAFP